MGSWAKIAALVMHIEPDENMLWPNNDPDVANE